MAAALPSRVESIEIIRFYAFSYFISYVSRERILVLEIVVTAKILIINRFREFISTTIEEIDYFTFSNNNDVVSSNEGLPNSIFVFDDVACDKQDAIRKYFVIGRHADVDCFYLCQMYAKVPKHFICDNANLLILFK